MRPHKDFYLIEKEMPAWLKPGVTFKESGGELCIYLGTQFISQELPEIKAHWFVYLRIGLISMCEIARLDGWGENAEENAWHDEWSPVTRVQYLTKAEILQLRKV